MTYRIEIKAETLSELAGKAYAFAVGVQSASRAESASFSVPLSHMTVTHSEPEVAEEAPAPLPSSGPTEAPPPTEEKASASSPTEASDAPSEGTLNFDTDVAPIVLQVVKDKGKPVVQEILEQFGVERASTLDPSRWPELVAQLKDAL